MIKILNLEAYRPSKADLIAYIFAPQSLTDFGKQLIPLILEVDQESHDFCKEIKKAGFPPKLDLPKDLCFRPLSQAYADKATPTTKRIRCRQVWTVKDYFPIEPGSDEFYLRPNKTPAFDDYKPLYAFTSSSRLLLGSGSMKKIKGIEVDLLDDSRDYIVGYDCFFLHTKHPLTQSHHIIILNGSCLRLDCFHRLMLSVSPKKLTADEIMQYFPSEEAYKAFGKSPLNRTPYLHQQRDFIKKSTENTYLCAYGF